MNFNVTTDVKNRIDNIETPNPTEAARNAASATKDKAVELATGIPAAAFEKFEAAFEEALAAMTQYGTMTARAYVNGYSNYVAGGSALADAFSANDPEMAYEAAREAAPHFFNGATDFLIADTMAIPIKQAFSAGATLISSTVTLSAIAELAIPVITIIAIGWAALKLRDLTATKMKDMVENALDGVPGVDTFDPDDDDDYHPHDSLDTDVEVVDVGDDEDISEVLSDAASDAVDVEDSHPLQNGESA